MEQEPLEGEPDLSNPGDSQGIRYWSPYAFLPEPITPIHPYLSSLSKMTSREKMNWALQFESEHPDEAAEFVQLITPWLDAVQRGRNAEKHSQN